MRLYADGGSDPGLPISTHAPLARCDPEIAEYIARCNISTHAPLARCDLLGAAVH